MSGDIILDNLTRLAKADFQTGDLVASGGFLTEEQAAKFIIIMIQQSKLFQLVTIDAMTRPKKLLENMRFNDQVLYGGNEGQALPEAQRSAPNLGKNELSVELFKGEVPVSDEVFEDNIEKEALRDTLRDNLARAVRRDLEKAFLNGDTASADSLLGKVDGVRKLTTSNTVVAGGVPISNTILNDMLKTMPNEFLDERNALRFITSVNAQQDLRNAYASRGTDLGDANLTGAAPINFSGVGIEAIPLMPENLGGGTNETEIILVDPKNVHFGILRNIKIEPDRDVRAGVWHLVATVRGDVQYEFEPASVKATGVTVS